MTSIPKRSTATPIQVQAILAHQLGLITAEPPLARQLPPIMLWGPPGVGKSMVVRTLCERQGIGFIDIRLSQREPVDLRGLPVPNGDRVDWLVSSEWPRDPQSRGILLFDEITAADRSLQVAAYEMILDRRLGHLYDLPDGWLVVGAGNRAEDRAVALTFSSALANRFCHLNVEPDIDSWCIWARANGVIPSVIGFLRFRPEALFDLSGHLEQGWPSPRSWTRVSKVLEHAPAGLDEASTFLMVEGLVGPGVATEFMAFQRMSRELPDVEAMLRGVCPISVPTTPDQRYAFTSALSHYLWRCAPQAETARIERFLKISLQLSADFATLALLDATAAGDDQARAHRQNALFGHPDFDAWSAKHGAVFTRHLQEAAGA